MADYEKCEYFEAVENTLESTVFDHPNYTYYCSKSGERKKIFFPDGCCNRCLSNNTKQNNK